MNFNILCNKKEFMQNIVKKLNILRIKMTLKMKKHPHLQKIERTKSLNDVQCHKLISYLISSFFFKLDCFRVHEKFLAIMK